MERLPRSAALACPKPASEKAFLSFAGVHLRSLLSA